METYNFLPIEKLAILQKQSQKLSAKELRSAEKYKYVNEEVSREVTESVEVVLLLLPLILSDNLIQETTELNTADPATYEAEKLFGIDLNKDDVQGRNVQAFDTDAYTTANSIILLEK